MREIEIMLSSIEDVKHFAQTITMFDGEFELVSGKYIVDAKYIEKWTLSMDIKIILQTIKIMFTGKGAI